MPTRTEKRVGKAIGAIVALIVVALLMVLGVRLASLLPGWVAALVIAVWLCGVFVVCVVKLFCALLDR